MNTKPTHRAKPASYSDLAARWQPGQGDSRGFWIFALFVVVLSLAGGLYLSSLPVPEQKSADDAKVPERIARFIEQKERPIPPPPPPKERPRPIEPSPPPVVPAEQPRVVRQRPEQPRKPLTERQEKARETASRSGLLAHMNELNELRDTRSVAQQLQRDLRGEGSGRDAAVHTSERLTGDANRASAGVDESQYATRAGSTELQAHTTSDADAALAAQAEEGGAPGADTDARTRSPEEITLVIDRHKSQLQALYNRARRSNPALRGKLVLAITIAPDGGVTAVKVVNSELKDSALESRIIARVKTFQFGAKPVETVTVHYPIEFLP